MCREIKVLKGLNNFSVSLERAEAVTYFFSLKQNFYVIGLKIKINMSF